MIIRKLKACARSGLPCPSLLLKPIPSSSMWTRAWLIGKLLLNVFWDCEGEQVLGFTARYGFPSVLAAELFTIKKGLQIAWGRRLPRIIVESDSEQAVNLRNKDQVELHPLLFLINDRKRLIYNRWNCQVGFVRRDWNISDCLAKIEYKFVDPPLNRG